MIKSHKKIFTLKIIQFIIVSFFFILSNSCSVNQIVITENNDVKKIIEEGKKDDIFLLKAGVYLNIEEIKIPNGVKILGEKNVTFRRTKDFNGAPVFNLSNASSITIKNITIELFSNSKGILSNSKIQTEDIVLKDIIFRGNFDKDETEKKGRSNLTLTLENVQNLEIDNLDFQDTFGGIYLNKITNGKVNNNTLNRVNFGNIVVSNSKNITIDHNSISQPGKGSKYNHPSGDGITFGGINDNIFITSNTITQGYCYLIWVVGSINNSVISDNTFSSGVTTALCINNGDNVIIENNEFRYSLANGILLNDNYNNITIENNTFYNDGIISRNGKSKNINIVNNVFKENYKDEKFVGVIGKATKNEGNTIDYIKKDTIVGLILMDENKKIIKHGESYSLDSNTMEFEIKNTGIRKISLSGFPQIILKDVVLKKNSRGDRKSGASAYNNFTVSSRNQPNVLTLGSNESAFFTLNSNKEGDSIIINIPTYFKKYNPFWIKVDRKN